MLLVYQSFSPSAASIHGKAHTPANERIAAITYEVNFADFFFLFNIYPHILHRKSYVPYTQFSVSAIPAAVNIISYPGYFPYYILGGIIHGNVHSSHVLAHKSQHQHQHSSHEHQN